MSTNLLDLQSPPASGVWVVDRARSTVTFQVRHMHFAKVEGRFSRFHGRANVAGIHGTVDVASIDTGDPIRDERLRSAGFFDIDRHRTIQFHAPGPLDTVMTGLLTICGVTRPVIIDVGETDERDGELRLIARTSVSRKDYRLTWSGLVKAGEVVVADRVEIRLELVLVGAST
jgi:polyisoprenoid-binding protein YceI